MGKKEWPKGCTDGEQKIYVQYRENDRPRCRDWQGHYGPNKYTLSPTVAVADVEHRFGYSKNPAPEIWEREPGQNANLN